ncbi:MULTISPECIES: flagellar basal body P-ring formation chaperone FlgA [unclassified Enterobacter]|uniref:flagellar basal body P-ring formation chaperone FlgA n=1 Tax=unclassified Enterobacter TaxID=2608935 RepID=UPI001620DF4B|nr:MULTISPECIES: flagellar basal body P-ring formation chaperone FlgA [unclassified Enterobacter]
MLLCFAAGIISPAQADETSLVANITTLVRGYTHAPPQAGLTLHVTLRTPPGQLATLCTDPELSLSGNLTRLAGPHTLIARCSAQRHFIQIDVDATATWWQAAYLLPAGQAVSQNDIRPQRGSLAHLPTGLILDPQRIIGRVTLRAVHPGENIVESQLRLHWAIRAGQRVELTLAGTGFSIKATGKALENAALNAPLRVQTASGQIVAATAIADDKVVITAD